MGNARFQRYLVKYTEKQIKNCLKDVVKNLQIYFLQFSFDLVQFYSVCVSAEAHSGVSFSLRLPCSSHSSVFFFSPLCYFLPRSSSLFSSSQSLFYLITSIFCYATITVILRSCPSSTTNHSHWRYHRASYLWR